MNIRLAKPRRKPAFTERRLVVQVTRRIADLCRLNVGQGEEVTVVLAGRETVRELNERFLGHEGDTDVLAFDYRETAPPDTSDPIRCIDGGRRVAAEVYICLPVAVDAARDNQTSVSFEVILYIAHGFLHLAGLDDHSEKGRRQMRHREQEILSVIQDEFGNAEGLCIEEA